MTKLKITDFELIDHGIESSSYFQGCGTSFTNFEFVATGCGDNPKEAFEDLLDMVAQQGVSTGEPTSIERDGQSYVNQAAWDSFDTEGLELRICEQCEIKPNNFPTRPSVVNEINKEFNQVFDEDELDRVDFDSDEAYQTALADWETRYDEWEENLESEKAEASENCERYYYMSLRWNKE